LDGLHVAFVGCFSAARRLRQCLPLPDLGREPDFYHRGGQPLLFGLSAVQRMQCRLEDRRTRPVARQVEPDTARILGDDGSKFQQLIPQGRDLRIRQRRVFERQGPQPLHQGVGQCREQNAELVGIEVLATGACCKQPQLRPLDAILCFTACTVELIVQLGCITLGDSDISDHKAWVAAKFIPLNRPGFRGGSFI
jgi:hypothetical protein